MNITHGNILDWAREYSGPKFHALLCDPPYHLTEITKRFGKSDSAPAQFGTDGAFARASKGFMGKDWDGGDIAFNPATWAAIAEHLHPGAFGMAFSGSRGWHRMAVAIEDAGLIIHPTIFLYTYGSGFPKATRVKNAPSFDGHRYGGQAIKPAGEPIVTFSKPGLCYNEYSALQRDISLILEGLWRKFASNAELVSTAEQTVNAVLARVATSVHSIGNHLSASDAESHLHAVQQRSGKVRHAFVRSSAVTKRMASGSIAKTAASRFTRVVRLSKRTKAAIAVKIATVRTAQNSRFANVHNAESNSPQAHRAPNGFTVQPNAQRLDASSHHSKTLCDTAIAIDTRAAILQYNSEKAEFDLSMIWLWSIVWGDLYDLVSRCTTETGVKIITILRTLNSSLLRLMLASQDIVSERNLSDKLWSYAAIVNANFSGLLTCLSELNASALRAKVSPIIVFQRPYAGRPLDSIVATGAGALNIDQARIGTGTGNDKPEYRPNYANSVYGIGMGGGAYENTSGRWPANFALIHHPDCGAACHADCTVRRLGAQSGESESLASMRGVQLSGAHGGIVTGNYRVNEDSNSMRGHDDSGTASRFFCNADWMYERLEDADQVGYFAKASRAEREAGLDPRTIAMLGIDDFAEATINDGRAKSIDNPYQRGETTRRNIHATVKPISLARWLATLLLPPAEYGPRRLLVPFAGVASEMIGAMLAGWEEIEGIELGADHVEIARARMAYWQQRRYELLDPATQLTVRAAPDMPDGQLDMFYEDAA